MLKLIRELCGIPGISGREEKVRAFIKDYLKKSSRAGELDIQTDPLGSLIVKKGANPEKLALFAHMDEVGFMITHITGEGLLGFSPIGIDARVAFGRRVLVGDKLLPGAVGGTAWHHLEGKEREARLKFEQMAIDIGAADKEDAQNYVKPGDMAIFDAPFTELAGGCITSRALDDRVGCAILCRLLTETEHSFTAVFTVQEESGLIGAAAAAASVRAPVAIVLETTTAGDLPDVAEAKKVCRVGGGPVVSFADRGAIYNRDMVNKAMAAAQAAGIPAQLKEGVFGGNDSREVQKAGGGAKTLAISVPCRYLHSASCLADTADIEHTYALLRALLPELL